ncbi:Hypothetical protein KVN_LOCUS202 [uncultured virus]|nr:Hypothetical protein KVN_LOCUS202 [uncultured virus]
MKKTFNKVNFQNFLEENLNKKKNKIICDPDIIINIDSIENGIYFSNKINFVEDYKLLESIIIKLFENFENIKQIESIMDIISIENNELTKNMIVSGLNIEEAQIVTLSSLIYLMFKLN